MAKGEKPYLMAGSCYVVVENEKNEWLFVKRRNTGYQDGKWGLPGGHVKPRSDEEPAEIISHAAAREVREETNLDVAGLVLVLALQRNKSGQPINDRVDFYFRATNWSGQANNLEPDIHSEVAWHKPEDLVGEMMDFIDVAVNSIRHQRRFDSFGFNENT